MTKILSAYFTRAFPHKEDRSLVYYSKTVLLGIAAIATLSFAYEALAARAALTLKSAVCRLVPMLLSPYIASLLPFNPLLFPDWAQMIVDQAPKNPQAQNEKFEFRLPGINIQPLSPDQLSAILVQIAEKITNSPSDQTIQQKIEKGPNETFYIECKKNGIFFAFSVPKNNPSSLNFQMIRH